MCATMEPSVGLSYAASVPDATSYSKPCAINTTAPLFVHIPSIMMALHLVYEVCIFCLYKIEVSPKKKKKKKKAKQNKRTTTKKTKMKTKQKQNKINQ